MHNFDTPRLLADIGGTYARFALETSLGVFENAERLRCEDFADFFAAVNAYLSAHSDRQVKHAAIAIANPVDGDDVQMTNYHWRFSIEDVRQRLGLDTLVVVNDFTALAMAIPSLQPSDVRQVGAGSKRDSSVVGVLGSGSGLGVSAVISANGGLMSLGSEGGHMSFAPQNERELTVLRYAWKHFSHVSFERLVSASGIELIYRALAAAHDPSEPRLTAQEITRAAMEQAEPLALETLEVFCEMLGTAAANVALNLGALGGIYVGGGIVPRLGAFLDRSGFRRRFEDKGRFSKYLAAIPTYVITTEGATFTGVSAILAAHLRADNASSGATILDQIRRARTSLSKAESRVADYVMAHARQVLSLPVTEIANAAEVSQPTVIRFCRSLGCEGLSDFKLRLASGLSGTVPITHSQVTLDDSPEELGAKVLGNTASAILRARSDLNKGTIDRAIDWLLTAGRVEFFALGHSAGVALDAQFKFLRFGISSGASVDPRLQLLAARVLKPNDVVVIVSGGGEVVELIEVMSIAQARGAKVIAIAASQSALAKRADATLSVDHVEDVATHVPMLSRILHLLYIDILAVGIALRLSQGAHGNEPLGSLSQPHLGSDAPSVQRSGADGAGLANLTSHSR